MKHLTIEVKDNQYGFLMELLNKFSFVKVIEEPTDEVVIPEWHKKIVKERLKKYKADPARALNWDKVKKSFRFDK